jgi:hypothetical protein
VLLTVHYCISQYIEQSLQKLYAQNLNEGMETISSQPGHHGEQRSYTEFWVFAYPFHSITIPFILIL